MHIVITVAKKVMMDSMEKGTINAHDLPFDPLLDLEMKTLSGKKQGDPLKRFSNS